jgi:hypothetical protein
LQIHPVIGEARPASLTNKKQEFLPNPCDNLAKRSGASINCKKKKKEKIPDGGAKSYKLSGPS